MNCLLLLVKIQAQRTLICPGFMAVRKESKCGAVVFIIEPDKYLKTIGLMNSSKTTKRRKHNARNR